MWTEKNIVSIDITRAEIRCNVCSKSEKWSNPFYLTRRPSLNKKSKTQILIKTQKDLVKYFIAEHLQNHNEQDKLETS